MLYDAAGSLLAADWRIAPSGLTGRSFTIVSPGDCWRARAVGITVAQVVVSGPGGELSVNRRDGERGRDLVDVTETRGLLVATTTLDLDRGEVAVEIVGGSPDAAGVDAQLLAAAAFACAHLDGPARLLG